MVHVRGGVAAALLVLGVARRLTLAAAPELRPDLKSFYSIPTTGSGSWEFPPRFHREQSCFFSWISHQSEARAAPEAPPSVLMDM